MSLGYVEQALQAIVDGVVQSIEIAHANMKEGTISMGVGNVFNASVNRSPYAYLNNPEAERSK